MAGALNAWHPGRRTLCTPTIQPNFDFLLPFVRKSVIISTLNIFEPSRYAPQSCDWDPRSPCSTPGSDFQRPVDKIQWSYRLSWDVGGYSMYASWERWFPSSLLSFSFLRSPVQTTMIRLTPWNFRVDAGRVLRRRDLTSAHQITTDLMTIRSQSAIRSTLLTFRADSLRMLRRGSSPAYRYQNCRCRHFESYSN